MLKRQAGVTTLSQIILFILFLSWLLFLSFSPLAIHPDSGGYQLDADHLTQPGYTTMRPPLFPLFLKMADTVGIKMSILAFFVNVVSLLYLLWLSGGRQKLFSAKNSILLIGFFILPAFWSFSGAKLTESILPAVEAWIFIFLVEIFFPQGETSLGMIVLYSVCISLLSITLKPWIMFFPVIGACLLLAAGLLFRPFRFARIPALILLVVAGLCYAQFFKSSMSKSPMTGNMVLLLSSSGKSNDLAERLKKEKDQNSGSAVMFRELITDIDLINGKYHGDPFSVPPAELKILRFTDPAYQVRIKQAFMTVYFKRPQDIWSLAELGISRYTKAILLGWACLQYSNPLYGPGFSWFQPVSLFCVILLLVLGSVYVVTERKKAPARPVNPPLAIFSLCLFISGTLFALFLCLTGGVELARTVIPATLFQLLALVFYFNASRSPLNRTISSDRIDR